MDKAAAAAAGEPLERVPPAIHLDEEIFDVKFHPSQDVVAIGMVSGRIKIFAYDAASTAPVLDVDYHSASVRELCFDWAGEHLLSASADRSLRVVTAEGEVYWEETDAHGSGLNALIQCGETMFATGDDDGEIALWDARMKRAITRFNHHADVVTSFAFDLDRKTLLSVSGDGTLAAVDLGAGKLAGQSISMGDDQLSVAILKRGRLVVTGTNSGALNMFGWGKWDELEDRFPGHPESVDSMLPADEHTVITGSEDGVIRLVQLRPNKLVAPLGEHEDMPIEAMAMSHDRRLLGTASHDETLRFWDVSFLAEDDNPDDIGEDTEGYEVSEPSAGAARGKSTAAKDYEDEEEDDEDEEEEEEDEEEEEEDDGKEGYADVMRRTEEARRRTGAGVSKTGLGEGKRVFGGVAVRAEPAPEETERAEKDKLNRRQRRRREVGQKRGFFSDLKG